MVGLKWLSGVALVAFMISVSPSEAAYGFGDADYESNFLEYYSAHKLLTKCYGNGGATDHWQVFVDKVYDECSGNQYRSDETSLATSMAGLERASRVFFDNERLQHLAGELNNNVAQLSCVFKKLKLDVEDSGIVIGQSVKDYVSTSLAKKPHLKDELIKEVNVCEQETICGHFELLGPKFINFFKLVKFYKCWQDARLKACMRYDINSAAKEYKLEGFKDFMKDVDASGKRFMITAAYFNDDNKYGGLWEFY